MASRRDTRVVAKSYVVEVNGVRVPIRSWSGGKLLGEPSAVGPTGAAKSESTMGHNSISSLRLTIFVTPHLNVLNDIADEVANKGRNKRSTIRITERAKDKSVIKTFVYDQCLLTSLDFPSFDAHGGEILCQTATFKPQILSVI